MNNDGALLLKPPYYVGVDEAGRGPLAGPVVACAFYDDGTLQDDVDIYQHITDSKKLSPSRRAIIAKKLIQRNNHYVAMVDPAIIDEVNILQASLHAMRQAVLGLAIKPFHVMVDGNKIPPLTDDVEHVEAIVKGDSHIVQIAAASIIAKYSRDMYCMMMHAIYPSFNFAGHKGYPTKAHYHMLNHLGHTILHRQSFRLYKE